MKKFYIFFEQPEKQPERGRLEHCQEKILTADRSFDIIRPRCKESMEKLIERGLLFDHYGGLLSEKNKRIYEAAAVDDMSLSEIAEEIGISRQAVSDTLNRTDSKLRRYEDELHLIEKNRRIRDRLDDIRKILDAASDRDATEHDAESIAMVRKIIDSIEEEL